MESGMETLPTDDRIARAVAAMHAQLARPWRVDELAAIAQLSVSRFAHLFRRSLAVPPGRYLQNLRIDRARQLLEEAAAAVADVQRSVGYADPSHFARDFRRHVGVSPREYRRDHRRRVASRPCVASAEVRSENDGGSPAPLTRGPLEDL
jgi:transcriptional regulator GlxA family with amidase domain